MNAHKISSSSVVLLFFSRFLSSISCRDARFFLIVGQFWERGKQRSGLFFFHVSSREMERWGGTALPSIDSITHSIHPTIVYATNVSILSKNKFNQ